MKNLYNGIEITIMLFSDSDVITFSQAVEDPKTEDFYD